MGLTTALMGAQAGLSILGAGMKANAAKQQGDVAYRDLMYQAQVADYNAAVAGAVGETKLEQQQFKTADQIAQIKVNQAASGVDINSGSAPDVVESARRVGQLDALNIRNDAAREAYGYQTRAQAYRIQAKEAKKAGSLGAAAAILGGATSLLGSAADITKYQGQRDLKVGDNSVSWGF